RERPRPAGAPVIACAERSVEAAPEAAASHCVVRALNALSASIGCGAPTSGKDPSRNLRKNPDKDDAIGEMVRLTTARRHESLCASAHRGAILGMRMRLP